MRKLNITLTDLFPALADKPERAPGLHVSDVVYDLCSRIDDKRYPPRGPNDPPRVVNPRMEIGNAIEDEIGRMLTNRLSRLHAAHVVPMGELELDGLSGNPDFVLASTPPGWGFDDDAPAVIEGKGTWLSTNHDIDSGRFSYWVWQGKSYCRMLGINRLILMPLFINGNYTFNERLGGGPQFVPYGDDFTDRELAEHWLMVTNHAARMRAKGW